MKLSDFVVGAVFWTPSGSRWRCTDVGAGAVVAVKEDEAGQSLAEAVFDEEHLPGCSLEPPVEPVPRRASQAAIDAMRQWESSARLVHPLHEHAALSLALAFDDYSERASLRRLADPTPPSWGAWLLCEHANEFTKAPKVCSCRLNCYCRRPGHTCGGSDGCR